MDEKAPSQATNGGNAAQRHVALQKIYVRDASIEVPDGPRIFTREYKPEVNVDLNTRIQGLDDDAHQVMLTVTVTARQGDDTAYIVEVQQAGVFRVQGFDDDAERGQVLGAYCPSMLFPFVRETVADMIQRAGFPHFLLQPVNFDALYREHQQRGQQSGDSAPEATH